jgi:hypothetical protein
VPAQALGRANDGKSAYGSIEPAHCEVVVKQVVHILFMLLKVGERTDKRAINVPCVFCCALSRAECVCDPFAQAARHNDPRQADFLARAISHSNGTPRQERGVRSLSLSLCLSVCLSRSVYVCLCAAV